MSIKPFKSRCVIFDIDGTLADCDHRRHHVDGKDGRKKDWPAFFAAMDRDLPRRHVVRHAASLTYDCFDILLVTGRGEEYRDVTIGWLLMHEIPYTELFMRPANDYQPDVVVKKSIYETHIEPNWDVLYVLDDRDCVVKMWRDLGLECWQVASGNF